jgi:anti-sigma-K factor RskA
MRSANRELVDRLAAEYVLGTLRGRARRRFERWLVSPQVEAMVKAWEERLAGLEPPLEAVAPPPAVWGRIERQLALRRSRAVLGWVAMAAALALFALVAVLTLRDPAGDVAPPPTLASTQRGFLQADPQNIYWRVEVLGDSQEISMHVHKVHDLPPGKSHELWALPENGVPVSLGLMPHTGDHHRVLTPAQRQALARARQIAVSLEVEGGSTTGAPAQVLLVAPLAPA